MDSKTGILFDFFPLFFVQVLQIHLGTDFNLFVVQYLNCSVTGKIFFALISLNIKQQTNKTTNSN